jgi:transglutaminase-like putative cysteine protease
MKQDDASRRVKRRLSFLRIVYLSLIVLITIMIASLLSPGMKRIGQQARAWMSSVEPRQARLHRIERSRHANRSLFASQSLVSTDARSTVSLDGAGNADVPHLPIAAIRFESETAARAAYRRTLYLRLQTFDRYRAKTWQSTGETDVPTPVRIAGPMPVVRYTVFARPSPSGTLAVLAQPVELHSTGTLLRANGQVELSSKLFSPRISYDASSMLFCWQDIQEDTLSPAQDDALRPVQSLNAAVSHVLADCSSPQDAAAVRLSVLRDHLRRNYSYGDSNIPPEDGDTLRAFLEETGRGNCRIFATILTLMAREIGFPARLATGFCGGEIGNDGQSVVFYANELHAWTEVKTAEYGWVTIDATPPSAQAPPRAPKMVENGLILDGQAFPRIGAVIEWEASMAARQGNGSRVWRWDSIWRVAGGILGGLFVFLAGLAILVPFVASYDEETAKRFASPRLRHPRCLRLFLKRMAQQGHPIKRGQTLHEYVCELQSCDLVESDASDLVAYVYGVTYEGKPRCKKAEKALSHLPYQREALEP